jgi:hypothetical protein
VWLRQDARQDGQDVASQSQQHAAGTAKVSSSGEAQQLTPRELAEQRQERAMETGDETDAYRSSLRRSARR